MHLRFKQKKCGFYYEWLFSITEPSNDNDENKLGFPIIIGISCGGAFLLLLVIIVLINQYKKNKMYILRRKKQPNSGEDYELKEPKFKENILDKDVEGKVNETYNYWSRIERKGGFSFWLFSLVEMP